MRGKTGSRALWQTCVLWAAGAAMLALPAPRRAAAGLLINPGAENARIALAPAAPLKATPFDMTQVKLLDSPYKSDMEAEHQYLLGLDNDRLLYNFRATAKLPTGGARPLGGWESPTTELRGHYVGHVLSGMALMYASTGDEKLKTKAAALVMELAKCQSALGTSGYLSGYPEDMIMELVNGTRMPWAPWYTLHKIMAGLLDQYVLCDNHQALVVVEGMARWTGAVLAPLSDEQLQRMLQDEFGGMREVLTNLYTVTGKKEYLETAGKFYHKKVLDPLAEKRDELQGLHVNTNVPKMIGEAAVYEMTGDARSQTIADYFWNESVFHRVYITGGLSYGENFAAPPDVISTILGPTTHENCVSYNLLKLTRHIFTWTADPVAADYYERNLMNAIMGTQDPEPGRGGSFMYSVPMGSGYTRSYNNQDNEFTCCLGTGLESFAKMNDSIYFHDADSVFVNLFIPSELDWAAKGLTIRQETKFPAEEGTTLAIGRRAAGDGAPLNLKIRIPYWATGKNAIAVNGKPLDDPLKPDTYAAIKNVKDGDKITVALPMSLRVEATPDNKNKVSVMYGPLVLAGKLPNSPPGAAAGARRGGARGRGATSGVVPALAAADLKNPGAWLKKTQDAAEPVAFMTTGQPGGEQLELVPFMNIGANQRYAIYWDLSAPAN